MKRHDDRQLVDLRPIRFEPHYIKHHPGSVLVSFGDTKVLVTCTIEERVPSWRVKSQLGWLTASYDMLPASTHERRRRSKNGPDGRASEIQRLIGRSLRNIVDLSKIGQRTLNVDCDVIQADGGTRTAAITGGYVAVMLAIQSLVKANNDVKASVSDIVTSQLAAISLGIKDGHILTDLCYVEDVDIDTDFNLVATKDGRIIEVQGTAEGQAMTREEVDAILDQGLSAIATLCDLQNKALAQNV